MGKYIATTYFPEKSLDSRNQYCPETITSIIQWRTFLAALLSACGQNSNLVDHDMLWSNWSKKFKEHFPEIISETAKQQEVELNEITFKYQCPRGKAKIRLADYMTGISGGQEASSIRITTIHQVKGETHDATLLVSAQDKRGGKEGTGLNGLMALLMMANTRDLPMLPAHVPSTCLHGQSRKTTKKKLQNFKSLVLLLLKI